MLKNIYVDSDLAIINKLNDKTVSYMIWLKSGQITANIEVNGIDVTVQPVNNRVVINGSWLIKDNGSLTIINSDIFSDDIVFYLAQGMVNLLHCNVIAKSLAYGAGRLSANNCNIHCNISDINLSIKDSLIKADTITGSGNITNSNISAENISADILTNNCVIINNVKSNRFNVTNLKYVPPVLLWTDQRGNIGYVKGESVDGFQTYFAILPNANCDIAKNTPGFNGQPPDDCFIEDNVVYGIWVTGKSKGKLKWSNIQLIKCKDNAGTYEGLLAELDISKRYWRAIAYKIPGIDNRPPDEVRLENNKVFGIWYNIPTSLCPKIQWNNFSSADDITIKVLSVPGDTSEQLDMAKTIPDSGKLPDVVIRSNGKIYGGWIKSQKIPKWINIRDNKYRLSGEYNELIYNLSKNIPNEKGLLPSKVYVSNELGKKVIIGLWD